MKFALVLFFFFVMNEFAHADSTYVTPGLYYSNGDYNNSTSSSTISFFNTAYINKYYATLGLDWHKLKGSGWKYDQFNYTVNLFVNEFPTFYKLSYMLIDGQSDFGSAAGNSQSQGNLVNFEYTAYKNLFYYSAGVTFFSQSGTSKEKSIQLTPRLDYIFSRELSFSIRPNYFLSSVGSSLFSTKVGLTYNFNDIIFFGGGISIGNQKYFFNGDLLTIYNQPEIQKTIFDFRIDYILSTNIRVIGSYNNSSFDGYKINYFSLGLKSGFYF